MDPRPYLTVAVILFLLGAAGFLVRRNLLVLFLAVELMLNGAGLALITFARMHLSMDGEALFFIMLALAAAESAVGLAMVIAIYRNRHHLDADKLDDLKG